MMRVCLDNRRIMPNLGPIRQAFSLDETITCAIVYFTYKLLSGAKIDVSDDQNRRRTKVENLAQEGTLNPTSGKVRDPKFQEGGFFDPRDVVQVKYEMLRRVSVEKASVTDASDDFGVSRPTFYQAKSDFDDAGIAGLVPKKRGPRGPNKLQGEILAFIKERLLPGQPIRARDLVALVRDEFGLDVHPRTIERAISGKKTTQ
jgi:transposase